MLHELKKLSVYELRSLIRRAGLNGATVQVKTDGRNSTAYYLSNDLPERYDNRLIKEYSMNLSKKLVTVTLHAM
jgi:hypothetical protein